ncbi:MAG: hypothetical protein EP330_24815 [Deltaproteobacteria bacterium]|nr:MAG: hypothetical protein EP330_24815 [Deltaproteobacteria bacterium]
MADPHHVPELDGFDRGTVGLYRAGLVGQAVLLVVGGVRIDAPEAPVIWAAYAGCVALTALNMHLYMKSFRWVISGAAWLGLVLQVAASAAPDVPAHWLWHTGLGFLFVASSAWALKERFCFRVPGMRFVPLMLAASLVPIFAGQPHPFGPLIAIAGLLFAVLAVAKLRMPLHFDVGDKSKYQV